MGKGSHEEGASARRSQARSPSLAGTCATCARCRRTPSSAAACSCAMKASDGSGGGRQCRAGPCLRALCRGLVSRLGHARVDHAVVLDQPSCRGEPAQAALGFPAPLRRPRAQHHLLRVSELPHARRELVPHAEEDGVVRVGGKHLGPPRGASGARRRGVASPGRRGVRGVGPAVRPAAPARSVRDGARMSSGRTRAPWRWSRAARAGCAAGRLRVRLRPRRTGFEVPTGEGCRLSVNAPAPPVAAGGGARGGGAIGGASRGGICTSNTSRHESHCTDVISACSAACSVAPQPGQANTNASGAFVLGWLAGCLHGASVAALASTVLASIALRCDRSATAAIAKRGLCLRGVVCR